MGFEPMNNGFADRPLGPLGYATKNLKGWNRERSKGSGRQGGLASHSKLPRALGLAFEPSASIQAQGQIIPNLSQLLQAASLCYFVTLLRSINFCAFKISL